MKCPNCGADMKDGSLYCEQCGEDIHIVPDFEPELEFNMEQTLHDIVKDIHNKGEDEEPENGQEQDVDEESYHQDWDAVKEVADAEAKKKSGAYLITAIAIGIFLIASVCVVMLYKHYSLDYQYACAEKCIAAEEYDMAITYFNRALELDPDSVDLKFSLAEVYFLKNNKIEYEFYLREIIKDTNASSEQLESAYGKLIAIYRARKDYKTINEMLLASNNESVMSKYQSYIAANPVFSVKEGNYTSIQPLKLTNSGTGNIYYTLDGTAPNENSLLYTAPILLEDGDYCVKACYINELGVSSEVVTMNYNIEIALLPSPELSLLSGEYQFPVNIEILDDYSSVYYTKDGSVPNEHSSVYNGPIPMPLGKSVFKFIRIEGGRSSEVVERTFELTMNTAYTPQEAVADVVQYSIDTGKIQNTNGKFDDSDAVYLYEFQYATNINQIDDFYVVSEIFSDSNRVLTKTGNHFALNAYTRELFKLQVDEQGNFNLVEIERESQ